MSQFFRTIHAIHRNPDRRMIQTGEWDEAGNAKVKAVVTVHAPETVLELDNSTEIAELMAHGAIVPISDDHLRIFNATGVLPAIAPAAA